MKYTVHAIVKLKVNAVSTNDAKRVFLELTKGHLEDLGLTIQEIKALLTKQD